MQGSIARTRQKNCVKEPKEDTPRWAFLVESLEIWHNDARSDYAEQGVGAMQEEKKLPFHSFAFTLLENRQPRTSLRMTAKENGMYELHVQKGSATNPSSQFTREVPSEMAERLRDTLQRIGAFSWEGSYGDTTAPGSRRWTMSVVFQEGVFSLEAKGGSDVPAGFADLLEELYRLDFPRPVVQRGGGAQGAGGSRGVGSAINAMGLGGLGSLGGMSAGDLGAYSSSKAGVDFSQIADSLKGGLGDIDAREMQNLMSQAQTNPQALQQRMKEEFRHLSPAEQNQMLDSLAATGMATREWWERFFGFRPPDGGRN